MRINQEFGLGSGAGDAVMCCWFPEITSFFCKGTIKKQIFDLFGFAHDSDEPEGKNMEVAFKLDLKSMALGIPRIESWSKALKLKEVKRPTYKLTTSGKEWAANVTRRHPDPIVLFPTSNVRNREWPACYWLDLAWKLKNKGYCPVLMLKDSDDRFRNSPSYFYGYCIDYLAAIVEKAKLVVGNDSFGVHLSSTMGKQTIVLGGPTTDKVFHHTRENVSFVSSTMNCTGCCYQRDRTFRAACDIGCASLYSLNPDDVLKAIEKKLSSTKYLYA